MLNKEQANYLSSVAAACFKVKKLEPEDLAPLLYLKFKLEGLGEQIKCEHVVIDEAQDFSLFQLEVLKVVLGTDSFTLLGDLAQKIHAYRGIKQWQEAVDHVFGGDATFLELQKSYRATIEIMTLANRVLEQGEVKSDIALAEPVVRHGRDPEINLFTGIDELGIELKDKIGEIENEGYQSIALVGKTWPECASIRKMLAKQGLSNIPILTGNEDDYQAGVFIIPSYATKGLEFDVVFVINIEEVYGYGELDTTLLYVSLTRAMHRLFVYELKSRKLKANSHIAGLCLEVPI